VRDEDQRAVVDGQRPLELLDGGQVEVVRRLVEHEAARAAGRLQRQLRARPLAGGQARASAQHVLRVEVEFRQQRASIALAQRRRGAERCDERQVVREQRPRLPDLAEHD